MHGLRSFAVRFLNYFRRSRVEADLTGQLEAHRAMLEEHFVGEGMTESEARIAAARAMGNGVLARELTRNERFFAAVESLTRDVQLALRRLSKRPVLTLVSVLALALGIGAAAATWSLLTAVLIDPLPVQDSDQLYVVGTRSVRPDGTVALRDTHIYTTYATVRDARVFETLTAGGSLGLLLEAGDRPDPGEAYFASDDFFEALGVRPALGRVFTPEDDRQGAPVVGLLSDGYWRRAFGGDPNVLGREIRVSGYPVTIVGVVPRGFRGLNLSDSPDVYLPLNTVGDVTRATSPSWNFFARSFDDGAVSSPSAWITLIGRLRAGEDPDQALAGLGQTYTLTSLNTAAVPASAREGMSQFTRLLGLTVGLLLLAGCMAVGMLLLMQTEARRSELAMCLALGASVGRLARSVAVEGGLLTLGGTLLALPVARWLFWGVRGFELPGQVSIDLLELSPGIDTLEAAAAGAVMAAVLIALIAVSAAWSLNLAHALASHHGLTMSRARRRTRAMLVVAQVAVALVLLVGTGLFARSIGAALSLNPGYDTRHVMTASLRLSAYGYSSEEASAFFDELGQRIEGNPAVRSVSMVRPVGGMSTGGELRVDDIPLRFPSFVEFTGIDEQYFSTIGLPIVQGRDFTQFDGPNAPRVAIVSESLARLLRNGEDPLGSRITDLVYRPPDPPDIIEVVGVVPDIVTNVRRPEPLMIYRPISQLEASSIREVVLRVGSDSAAAVRETASAIRALDADVTPEPLRTIDERLTEQMSQQQFGMVMMGGLGMIALLLTVLAIYVMAASMASGRRRELAIRAALGATGWSLGSTILVEAMRLVGIGVALALGLTWAGSGMIRAFLYGIQPLDPVTLFGVSAFLIVLTVVVCLKPVCTVMRLDAARTLRED